MVYETYVLAGIFVGLPLLGAGMSAANVAFLPALEWPSVFVLGASILLYGAGAALWWALDSPAARYLGTWCLVGFLAAAWSGNWFRGRSTKNRKRREAELTSPLGLAVVVILYVFGFWVRA